MFVNFVGAASLMLRLMNTQIRFECSMADFFDRILCKLPCSGIAIFSVISSLPKAFRGLGFSFTAVRFTLPFESNNVFQIRHLGASC